MPKNHFRKISSKIRTIFPERKRGSVTITPKETMHTIASRGTITGVFIPESGEQNNFTYTVRPLLKQIKIDSVQYHDINGLAKILSEARALAVKHKLPLKALRGSIKMQHIFSGKNQLNSSIDIGRNTLNIQGVFLAEPTGLKPLLEQTEKIAVQLGLNGIEWTLVKTGPKVDGKDAPKLNQLPEGWTINKRSEVGSRGGVRTTYLINRKLK